MLDHAREEREVGATAGAEERDGGERRDLGAWLHAPDGTGTLLGVGEEQLRRSRREFVRRQHPDRGGDPRVFREGLAAYDAAAAARATPDPRGTGEGVARSVGRWMHALRQLPRDVQAAYREGRDGDVQD